MKKKYFFFDIDGTLTDDATHLIVPSAKLALDELKQAGHFVAIATGRVHYKTKSFSDSIDIHNLVCSGGGCIAINDEILFDQPLEHDKAVRLIENAEKNHIGWTVILDDTDKIYMKDTLFLEQAGLRTELTTYILDKDFDYHEHEIEKIYLAISAEDEKKYDWLDEIAFVRMGDVYCVFQYDKKDAGIEKMMEILHAPIEDVVVFGDGKNDAVMFDSRWTSIAMGNAADSLKQKATYVTSRNTEDGIMNACKHFNWI